MGLNELDDIETVRYDAVDITREMLQIVHRNMFASLVEVSYVLFNIEVVQIGKY